MNNARPWVRFWARGLDISLYSLIITFAFPSLVNFSIYMQEHIAIQWYSFFQQIAALGLISLAVYIIFESLLLSTFGTTLGKWLFRVSLKTADDKKLSFTLALKRTFLMYFRGLALLLPFLSIITLIYAYASLSSSGSTSWDKECHTVITHQRIGFLRIVIFIILLIFFSDLKSKASGMEMMTIHQQIMYACGI
ncbi:MAG: RDD family protein, partial [Gammaproteobacteria bacterium]|nr:RDD family protein [Gammaproteobacteria bacterium]